VVRGVWVAEGLARLADSSRACSDEAIAARLRADAMIGARAPTPRIGRAARIDAAELREVLALA
jgi:hypothetical protein